MKHVLKFSFAVSLLAMMVNFQHCYLIEDEVNAICNKDCTEIKGQFTTEDSTVPVKGVELKLAWVQGCYKCWFSDRDIATGKTDQQGNYNFIFYPKESELTAGYFEVSFPLPDTTYLSLNYIENFIIYPPNKRSTLIHYNYIMPRKGLMRLILTNPDSIPAGDRLVAQVFFKYGDKTRSNWTGRLISGETTLCCWSLTNNFS